jgi:hypothetical protein
MDSREELLVMGLAFQHAQLTKNAAPAFAQYVMNHPFYAQALSLDSSLRGSVRKIESYEDALRYDKYFDDLQAYYLYLDRDGSRLLRELNFHLGIEGQALLLRKLPKEAR